MFASAALAYIKSHVQGAVRSLTRSGKPQTRGVGIKQVSCFIRLRAVDRTYAEAKVSIRNPALLTALRWICLGLKQGLTGKQIVHSPVGK